MSEVNHFLEAAESDRQAAWQALKAAASRCIGAEEDIDEFGDHEELEEDQLELMRSQGELYDCWQAFPECSKCPAPPAQELLQIMERQERIAEQIGFLSLSHCHLSTM